MTDKQWYEFKDFIKNGLSIKLPVGFIIDSPWLPGWNGISMIDYYTSDEKWLKANFNAIETFPEVWFLPGFWSEYGMCTEPSAFGAKLSWNTMSLPHAGKMFSSIDETKSMEIPDVKLDGLLPFTINRLRLTQSAIEAKGYQIRFAVSRGPLNIASFLLGTSELMLAMVMEPELTQKFLSQINTFIIQWLQYQKECFPSIDGIFILDDLVGFLDEDTFNTYAKPLLKDSFNSFESAVHFFHNDAHGLVCAPYLEEIGVNLFNFSFEHSIAAMKKACGTSVRLIGNIPPRDVLAAGSPEDVKAAIVEQATGCTDYSGVIWSCGGGMPPNVPSANIQMFIDTVNELSLI
jgi:uroporphyrinogen-III decarboxylase